MEVGGPYRVRQSMSSHVEHRSYDFANPSMSCLSSPAIPSNIYVGFEGFIFVGFRKTRKGQTGYLVG